MKRLCWSRRVDPVTGRMRLLAAAGGVVFGVYEGTGQLHVWAGPQMQHMQTESESEASAKQLAQSMVDTIVRWGETCAEAQMELSDV